MAELHAVCSALAACEKQMRTAISEAAAAAEPERLNQLVRWLGEIQRIAREAAEQEGTTPTPGIKGTPVTPGAYAGAKVSRSSKKAAAYPKFFRDDESLVKVGWSKSEGAEYEHKCSRRVLDTLATECAKIAGPGKRFVMDKLLPLRDPASGTELPGYQAYVALAFLKYSGLVQQHGRSGYSIPKPKTLVADAAAAWNGSNSR